MACKRNILLVMQILVLSLSAAGVMLLTAFAFSEQGNIMLRTVLAFGAEGNWKQACPPYCLQVSYTSCPVRGEEVHSQPYCNCCFLEEAIPDGVNCTLYLTDDSKFPCY